MHKLYKALMSAKKEMALKKCPHQSKPATVVLLASTNLPCSYKNMLS